MSSGPSTVARFDAYADAYEDALQLGLHWSGESSAFFARGRLVALAGRLRELGERPAVILDFGCGAGASTPLAREILGAERAIGVDVSPRLLSIADRRHRADAVEYHHRNVHPRHVVDCAYANGVFHHIALHERADAVAYVFGALRPGGLFALCENNPWNPGTRLVMRSIPFDRDAEPLQASAARRLLRGGGFEILTTDFLFFFPHALRALRRYERRLRSAPLGAQYMIVARRPEPNGRRSL
jgi:SAM-dependent methyltransferase